MFCSNFGTETAPSANFCVTYGQGNIIYSSFILFSLRILLACNVLNNEA